MNCFKRESFTFSIFLDYMWTNSVIITRKKTILEVYFLKGTWAKEVGLISEKRKEKEIYIFSSNLKRRQLEFVY